MLMNWLLALIFIAMKVFIGAIVGAFTTWVIHRSHLRLRNLMMAALLSSFAYLLASGVAGWADSHAAFENGRRLDIAPWGEDLPTRNWIVEHKLLIALGSSVLVALVYGMWSQSSKRSEHSDASILAGKR